MFFHIFVYCVGLLAFNEAFSVFLRLVFSVQVMRTNAFVNGKNEIGACVRCTMQLHQLRRYRNSCAVEAIVRSIVRWIFKFSNRRKEIKICARDFYGTFKGPKKRPRNSTTKKQIQFKIVSVVVSFQCMDDDKIETIWPPFSAHKIFVRCVRKQMFQISIRLMQTMQLDFFTTSDDLEDLVINIE